MSRLHDPGPGEILDRLTILALKIVHGRLAGVPVDHWEAEAEALDNVSKYPAVKVWVLCELAATNAALWQAEDTLRRLRTEGLRDRDGVAFHAEAGRAGMQIQQLNDRRADLVALINTHAGRPTQKEKLCTSPAGGTS